MVLRKELPVLTIVTALAAWQLADREICRNDATILLAVFAGLMAWAVWTGFHNKDEPSRSAVRNTADAANAMPIRQAVSRLVTGLVLLIASSRIWLGVPREIAMAFRASDLFIGLTVIALGTSLPELASPIAAIRKKEHDIALGTYRVPTCSIPWPAGHQRTYQARDRGTGGLGPGRAGHGRVDPFAVHHRLQVSPPRPHQSHRGRRSAGVLCSVYGLPPARLYD